MPANGFNGRALPDTTVIGGFTATNFFVSCLRRDGKFWISGAEGRLARDLKELGHRIVGIDSSPSLVAAAREFDPSMDVRLTDAAALPLDDACADLAVAFMSLQDIDGMPAAIQEAARVLEPGGRFCLAIVHPINSAGSFEEATADGHFVIKGDYLHAFH